MKFREIFKKYHLITFILVFAFIVLGTLAIFVSIFGDRPKYVAKPPEFICDASLTEPECAFFKDSFENSPEAYTSGPMDELKYQLSAETVYEYIDDQKTVVYSIELPVVDFYDGTLDVSSSELEPVTGSSTDDNSIISQKPDFVKLKDLNPASRVLSIDGQYFFDDFKSGAKFRLIHISASDENAANTMAIVKNGELRLTAEFLKQGVLSFAQTGVTALTRAMTTTLNNRAGGDGAYFAAKIKDFLNTKDLTHISNEVSFINGCKGGTNTMMLCADWRSLDAITSIGTDIVELSGNHNNNYGYQASLDTIEKYRELGIATVGGGADETSAKIPVRIYDSSYKELHSVATDESSQAAPLDINGVTTIDTTEGTFTIIPNDKSAKITLLAYNNSTSTKGNGELANGSRPGANGYVEAEAAADIQAAKDRGDFVIVDVQFFECYCYPDSKVEYPACDAPINGQQSFFRHFIDLGADMVVGTQAHQPQTFELYAGKPIYYGLGNLFFDQTYWPDTMKGLILTHYFYKGNYLQTRISPTIYDTAHQVELMQTKSASSYLSRLIKSSPAN